MKKNFLTVATIMLFLLTFVHLVSVLINPPVVRADYASDYYFGCTMSEYCKSDRGPCFTWEWTNCVAYLCTYVEYSGACGLGAQDHCYDIC